MPDHNVYLAYKRDGSYILWWLIDASNTIIRKTNAWPSTELVQFNTTGKATVADILAMCKLVAAQPPRPQKSLAPDVIFSKFQSVISGRKAALNEFERIQALFPDDETEMSNKTHRFYVESLENAFDILGGRVWEKARENMSMPEQDEQSLRQEILANRFSALYIDTQNDTSDDESVDAKNVTAPKAQKQQPSKGKGGKKRGVKPRKGRTVPKEEAQLELPWESYRIIDDAQGSADGAGGLVTDYLLAALSAANEWTALRLMLQGLWGQVVHDELNSAVAATTAKIYVGMVKRTEAAISIDFPGNDSFDAIMQTLTKGNLDQERRSYIGEMKVPENKSHNEEDRVRRDAMRDQMLVTTYNDLLDFLDDFQKNQARSGKPTKAMAAHLGQWDPDLDLRRATEQQRLLWRRTYTINWLYELVNVVSFDATRNPNEVNWTTFGSEWQDRGRIFGLHDFAKAVTTLAVHKPVGKVRSDVRYQVTTHLVFELTCIVDSMCISKGWSPMGPSATSSLIMAPAKDFKAARDIETFLDRSDEEKSSRPGVLGGLRFLLLPGSPIPAQLRTVLEQVRDGFKFWLGRSRFSRAQATMPPSRFALTSLNGLYEYSPYLCGMELAEALEISFRCVVELWEDLWEPYLMTHLHRMLVKEGYLKEPVKAFEVLEDKFSRAWFGVEHVEDLATGKYLGDFKEHFRQNIERRDRIRARQTRRGARSVNDIDNLLSMDTNGVINQDKTLLINLREAGWDAERIPIANIATPSFLAVWRITAKSCDIQLPGDRDEDPGLLGLEGDLHGAKELSRRWKLNKNPMLREIPDSIFDGNRRMQARMKAKAEQQGAVEASGPDKTTKPKVESTHKNRQNKDVSMISEWHGTARTPGSVLEGLTNHCLQEDIESDICGNSMMPLYSGYNYFWFTVELMQIWQAMEDKLIKQNNSLFHRAYNGSEAICGLVGGGGNRFSGSNKARLTMLALKEKDGDCLKIMAEIFKEASNLANCTYWKVDSAVEAKFKRMFPQRLHEMGFAGEQLEKRNPCTFM